jgi:Zn-dependent protease with chaperone function
LLVVRERSIMYKVVRGKKPNAFAIGVPGLNVILVTSAAVECLDDNELAGLLAHEQTHINQFHMVARLGVKFLFLREFRKAKKAEDAGRLLALQVVQTPTLCTLSYVLERLADRGARKAGLGSAAASALLKMDKKPNSRHVLSWVGGNAHPRTCTRVVRLTK